MVRADWVLNQTWSVVALRAENPLFVIDFLENKRFTRSGAASMLFGYRLL
jgi:hypothetical protein